MKEAAAGHTGAGYSGGDLSYPRGDDAWLVEDLLRTVNRPWRTGGPIQKRYLMNEYGKFALDQWRRLAPTALSEIPDPNRHFSMLGEQAADQVLDLSLQLEGPDVAGETYMQKVGRVQNAKRRAEEIVRADLLIPPTDTQDPTEDDPPLTHPRALLLAEIDADLASLNDQYLPPEHPEEPPTT